MNGLVCLLSLPLYGTFACGLKRTSAASRAVVPVTARAGGGPYGGGRGHPGPSARAGPGRCVAAVAWPAPAAARRSSAAPRRWGRRQEQLHGSCMEHGRTSRSGGRPPAGVRAGRRVCWRAGGWAPTTAAPLPLPTCWAGRAGAGRGGAPQATGMVWAGSGKYDCVTITLQSSLWLKAQRRPAGPPARRPVQVPPARRPAGWPACPAASPPQ